MVIIQVPEGDRFTHETRVDDKVRSICDSYRLQGSGKCPCGMYEVMWT